MSQQTNKLLNLFSKLLRNPNVLFALRASRISDQMKNRGNRNGAQGLLVELWEKDGLTNAEISELLDIKPSSVTAQVKKLEEDGFAKRIPDENDKRVSRIYLTDKGREAQKKRSRFHNDMSEDIFGNLSPEEQEQLQALMEKLTLANDFKDEDTYQKMERFFGDPMMENLMNTHDWHVFGREMGQLGRQMGRNFRQMRTGMPHSMENEKVSKEEWKNMINNLKQNFKENFANQDEDETTFEKHWNDFMESIHENNHYFDQKRSDFRWQPKFDRYPNEKKGRFGEKTTKDSKHTDEENWKDF